MTRCRLVAIAVVAWLLVAPAASGSPQSPGVPIAALVDDPAGLVSLSAAERSELRSLYSQNDGRPLWLDPAGRATGDAHIALALIGHAGDEGLVPADYHWPSLGRLSEHLGSAARNPGKLARFDVLLSAGVLRYMRHVHAGRIDPRSVGFGLPMANRTVDFAALLHDAVVRHQVRQCAEGLRPRVTQYGKLLTALSRYRQLPDRLSAIPPWSGSSVHPGDVYPATEALIGDLVALGDLPASTGVHGAFPRYEGAVVDGVKQFQRRHGLHEDGVLGKATLAALRTPTSWRRRQIELALERLRWLPDMGDERLITLNIPMFRLWAWEEEPPDGAPSFAMDVIVGRAAATQTPVMIETLREVVFRPYWNVPRSILRHELLPKISADPGYLPRENMEIVTAGDAPVRVDASPENLAALRRGSLSLRQRPGPGNALGLIKFVFPNAADVYMHGTPQQALFARSRRDFSHGCIRVADPERLAQWVLDGDPQWTAERISAAVSGTATVHVRVRRAVRVVLFYATAVVGPEDGLLRFADDIYGHDRKLHRALESRRPDG